MADLLAVSFDDLCGADHVLHDLRSLRRDDLIELEDACVAERAVDGTLHLKQAIGEGIDDALHPHFWRHLVGHILHHGRSEAPCEGCTPELGLDRGFVRQVAENLAPATSALFLVVPAATADPLIAVLKEHGGQLLRTSLPPGERQALARALAPQPPRLPGAAELKALAERSKSEKTNEKIHARQAADAERQRRIERLKKAPLTANDVAAVAGLLVDAAKRGETSVLGYRFPSELCSDRGRAINNTLPEWPETLAGQPRHVYEYWRDQLRPAGYHLRAQVLDYPNGVPGDVGFIFSWD